MSTVNAKQRRKAIKFEWMIFSHMKAGMIDAMEAAVAMIEDNQSRAAVDELQECIDWLSTVKLKDMK